MFDRKRLIAELNSVAPDFRYVFAAGCAERLMPALMTFSEEIGGIVNAPRLAAILEDLWSSAGNERKDEVALQRIYDDCGRDVGAIEDRGNKPTTLAAADAVACIGYAAMSALSKRSEDASWAGARASDTFYQFLKLHVFRFPRQGSEEQARTVAHPLYVAELDRQESDVRDLQALDLASALETVERIRKRAQIDGTTILRDLTSGKA